MTSLTPLQLSLEPMAPGLPAPDILTARGNDPWCHSAMVVNALRTATPFADWEVIAPLLWQLFLLLPLLVPSLSCRVRLLQFQSCGPAAKSWSCQWTLALPQAPA